MRVLFDGRSLQSPVRSGIPRVAAFWLQQLILEHGAEHIDVLTTGWKRSAIETYGAKHVHVRVPNKLLHLMLLIFRFPGLRRYAHVYLPNLHFFCSDVPYTLLVHDLSFLQIPWMYSRFERFVHALKRPRALIAGADQLLAVSRSTALDIERLCGRTDVRILDLHGMTLRHGKNTEDGTHLIETAARRDVVFLSTTETRKNLRGAIEGFLAFKQCAGAQWKMENLIVIGMMTREGRALQKQFAQNLDVVWLGTVDDATRNMLLGRAKVLLYPSFFEGFGIPLVEAQTLGTPIITSYATSMPEVAPHGILIDPTRTICVQQALEAVFVLYSAHERGAF